MATVIRTEAPGRVYRHTWTLLTADGAGDAVSIVGASDRTVQFIGANWGSATVVLEGSCEAIPTTWFALTDIQGNPISKTADGGEGIFENVVCIRPRLSISGTAAGINVILISRSTM